MDELKRLENQRKVVLTFAIINIVFLLLGVIVFSLHTALSVIFFAAAIIFFFAGTMPKYNAYTIRFKRELVETVLKRTFDNLCFEPKKGISRGVIAGTGMMRMGNRFYSNDYISGRYKNTAFEQSDVCIQNVTSDGKNTHTTTYFKGRWMIFDFNKNFAADLLVRESGFYYTKRKGGLFVSEEERMKRLKLEDEQFNREFDVFAQNEHEAYYMLTPHIMEAIRELNAKVSGKLILCFVNSKLHVGVHNKKDAFEALIFKRIDESMFLNIEKDIKVITSFIDELNLDRNIYKR